MLLVTCFIFGLLGSLTWAGLCGQSVCPSGTFAFEDGSERNCYKFYKDNFTFEEAEQECQFRWKGHLASFTNGRQAAAIGAYVSKENIERNFVWIGLRRDEGSSLSTGWCWVDGSQSRYRTWRNSEPNGIHEYCVGLYPRSGHLTWVDLRCRRKLPFLCKWSPT
ncbi:snaclec coagulation factor IX-binding protein subunit A-like [Thamnophis elegans]|uniref:snaclec coagulation factor IX-binding protein subunit A-like n=1 Tax=Thamnophis elegans TaxID=35005 RepID=UPI0013770FD8|nr:snaclec coagulation factor IX-binding protein subunit A-like [Thamnophis elegans]XP_032077954.1 snaclec coagulation factor IX-binding protein subunit A-like [Thamnophis elegans]